MIYHSNMKPELDKVTLGYVRHKLAGISSSIEYIAGMLKEGKTHYTHDGSSVLEDLEGQAKALGDFVREIPMKSNLKV